MSRLFDAAHQGDTETLATLLDAGASLSESDSRGWTALHFAANGGALGAASLLLDRGADANVVDRFGKTALFRAVFERHADMVRLLRARGANPLLGAAQFAREVGGPMVELFADLPAELPPAPRNEVTVLSAGRISEPPAGARWQDEHARLWKLLVPARGDAPTVQGEVIRCTGRLADEAYRNGNINWGPMHEAMCTFLVTHLADEGAFTAEEISAMRATVEAIRARYEQPDVSGRGSTYYRMSELAVRFCHAKPELVLRHS